MDEESAVAEEECLDFEDGVDYGTLADYAVEDEDVLLGIKCGPLNSTLRQSDEEVPCFADSTDPNSNTEVISENISPTIDEPPVSHCSLSSTPTLPSDNDCADYEESDEEKDYMDPKRIKVQTSQQNNQDKEPAKISVSTSQGRRNKSRFSPENKPKTGRSTPTSSATARLPSFLEAVIRKPLTFEGNTTTRTTAGNVGQVAVPRTMYQNWSNRIPLTRRAAPLQQPMWLQQQRPPQPLFPSSGNNNNLSPVFNGAPMDAFLPAPLRNHYQGFLPQMPNFPPFMSPFAPLLPQMVPMPMPSPMRHMPVPPSQMMPMPVPRQMEPMPLPLVPLAPPGLITSPRLSSQLPSTSTIMPAVPPSVFLSLPGQNLPNTAQNLPDDCALPTVSSTVTLNKSSAHDKVVTTTLNVKKKDFSKTHERISFPSVSNGSQLEPEHVVAAATQSCLGPSKNNGGSCSSAVLLPPTNLLVAASCLTSAQNSGAASASTDSPPCSSPELEIVFEKTAKEVAASSPTVARKAKQNSVSERTIPSTLDTASKSSVLPSLKEEVLQAKEKTEISSISCALCCVLLPFGNDTEIENHVQKHLNPDRSVVVVKNAKYYHRFSLMYEQCFGTAELIKDPIVACQPQSKESFLDTNANAVINTNTTSSTTFVVPRTQCSSESDTQPQHQQFNVDAECASNSVQSEFGTCQARGVSQSPIKTRLGVNYQKVYSEFEAAINTPHASTLSFSLEQHPPGLISGDMRAVELLKLGISGQAAVLDHPIGCFFIPNSQEYVVCDTRNNRIKSYNCLGQPKSTISTKVDGSLLFKPSAIAMTSMAPNAYAVKDDFSISIFSWHYETAELDIGRGLLRRPYGLASDELGYLYTIDESSFHNRKLCKFDLRMPYQPLTCFDFTQVASRPDGKTGFIRFLDVDKMRQRIVATDFRSDVAYVTDLQGGEQFRFGGSGAVDGRMYRPAGVTIDSSGNIFIADSGTNRIQIFDAFGQFRASIRFSVPISVPSGIHLTTDGNLMVSHYAKHFVSVYKIS